MATALEWPDILAIVLYFVLVLGVGFWASCRAQTDTKTGYFLAGRSSHWILVGASTFATNIGAQMFIGLAGSSAKSGLAVVMFEWHAMWMLLLLGWFFLPVYLASGTYTMPGYLKLRFGGQRIRIYLACVRVIITVISSISGQIYAGSLFISIVFEWDIYVSVCFILVITALYTIIGGLTAVLWTDAIQTIILIIGSIVLATIGLNEMGGFEALRHLFIPAAANYTYLDEAQYGNHSCGFPPQDAFHIFRAADSGSYPWPGMVFGLTILAINAWCTDQTCVQRSLSAKNMSHAKAGVLTAAYLKIFPFFFFVIPGMISRVMYPQQIGCADPDDCEAICANPSGCTNVAYPFLVKYMLPTGLKGLMMAALLAALMSSLTSTFNSSSTLFTLDIWRRVRPRARESELMVVGRLWTLFLAVLGVAWLPILEKIQGSNFWDYTQSISSFLNPPIVCTFVVGLLWRRATEQGAFAGLVCGLGIGLIRMGLEWSRPGVPCGSPEESTAFAVVANVHYLHFACILFACTFVVMIAVSLLTQPRPEEKLRRTTWWTRKTAALPELSEESEYGADTDGDEKQEYTQDATGLRYTLLKWLCGVDKTSSKSPQLSREEMVALQKKQTSLSEDPYWKRFLNVQGVIVCCVCFFLHAFWA